MEIKWLKMLNAGDRIEIKFIVTDENGKCTMEDAPKCTESPREQFSEVMADLKPHVIKICEEKVTSANMCISSIKFDKKDGAISAIFEGKVALVGSGFKSFVLPKKYTTKPNDNVEDCEVLKPQCAELVLKMIEECKFYIDGKRLQIECGIDEKKEEEKSDEAV